MTSALAQLAARLGVMPRYRDQTGEWHDTGPDTLSAVVGAMGFDTSSDKAMSDALAALTEEDEARKLPQWLVLEAECPGPMVDDAWQLTLESGELREGRGPLPALPLGIHRLSLTGHDTWLLAAPCRLPAPAAHWGLTLPLYGLRTAAQGGVGSYRDLAEVARGLAGQGAAFVGVNPIHAGFPDDPMAFSPYSPSSRRRFSTLHIDAGARPDDHGDLIDYASVLGAQKQALEDQWAAFGGDADFDAFVSGEGPALHRFALHQALSARHGPYWTDWPEALRDPLSSEVSEFAEAHGDAIRFHSWLQWRAEMQLAQVRHAADDMALGLYLDLAVGTHPQGAETWGDPDLFAPGCSLGAPPDAFSRDGQRWNLAPMRPLHLARSGFRALAEILRAQLRFARVLRIDHILGFERAFWVPENAPGAYVTMPKAALLAVARIEAARVGAVIIGEDLGNIPEGLHADLAASGILGCRVAMFEQDWNAAQPTFKPAAAYDADVLTSFATHDLATYRGWRRARDIEWREALGSLDAEVAARARTQREGEVSALARRIGGTNIGRLNGFLAGTPSRLVAVQAEDALAHIEQPNLPGTVYDHPNWRRRLGVAPQDLARHPGVAEAAKIMKTSGR
ncbi:4-alpha-glucanotransferase [Oceaniglobus trochenteri]|uniref:4-alpha-glucanotransferase n=1 Tax=Oceaniglobus trochenteri TaxID=2763260 RepID=UPI001CFF75F5|nr:4-alpha-glucanotransferase [Oceaniglobus trochenteri]